MNLFAKTLVVFMLMAIAGFVAGCTKPGEPNNGGNDGNDGNSDTLVVHEYVDLGLPSGTLWATCNLGADVPEDFGDYYSWGELEPKEVYDWSCYRYGDFVDERYELTKYCTDSNHGQDGFVDNIILLEPEDDVVQALWGTDWRMPNRDEWEELLLNTTSYRTTLNGVEGWLFTASNGNSLFLPAAGYWWNGEHNEGLGLYWSRLINKEFPYRTWGIHFNWDQCHICGSSDRCRGQSVRAVRTLS